MDSIEGEDDPPVSAESAMKTLKVVLAAYKLAKEKKMVKLS